MIKHSPAAIADSSLSLRRESRRFMRNAGSRRRCDASRAARNGKPTGTPGVATTQAAMAEMVGAEDTRLAHGNFTRRFARIAVARPRFRSCRARTSRFIAATASSRARPRAKGINLKVHPAVSDKRDRRFVMRRSQATLDLPTCRALRDGDRIAKLDECAGWLRACAFPERCPSG